MLLCVFVVNITVIIIITHMYWYLSAPRLTLAPALRGSHLHLSSRETSGCTILYYTIIYYNIL